MRRRRLINGAPHRYREASARIELAMTALLESLRQVDRVLRPRLDDCVVISAPPAVHQPQVAILWQKAINLDLGNGNANGLLLLVLFIYGDQQRTEQHQNSAQDHVDSKFLMQHQSSNDEAKERDHVIGQAGLGRIETG